MKKCFFVILLMLSLWTLNAQTVYVTENGKKYHAKNCNIVKTGKKGMDISEAKKKAYEPCKSCKAEEIKAAPAEGVNEKKKEKAKK